MGEEGERAVITVPKGKIVKFEEDQFEDGNHRMLTLDEAKFPSWLKAYDVQPGDILWEFGYRREWGGKKFYRTQNIRTHKSRDTNATRWISWGMWQRRVKWWYDALNSQENISKVEYLTFLRPKKATYYKKEGQTDSHLGLEFNEKFGCRLRSRRKINALPSLEGIREGDELCQFQLGTSKMFYTHRRKKSWWKQFRTAEKNSIEGQELKMWFIRPDAIDRPKHEEEPQQAEQSKDPERRRLASSTARRLSARFERQIESLNAF